MMSRTFVVVFMLLTAAAALAQDGKRPETGGPRTSEQVAKALDAGAVDLDLDEAPLLEVLDAQGERLGVAVVIDSGLREQAAKDGLKAAPVSLKGATGRAVLSGILASQGDLAFEVWRSAVYVTSKAKPSKLPPAPELSPAQKKLWDKKSVALELKEASLEDAATAIAKASGLPLVAGPKAEGKVTLVGKDLPAGAAVDLVCRALGLKVVKAGEKLELRPRAPGDKSAPPEKATLDARKKTAAEAKKANEALERALDEKKVELDFEDAALSEVLDHIQESSGLSFAVDPAVDQTKLVTASAKEISVRDALAKVLTSLGYVALARDGVLVVKPR